MKKVQFFTLFLFLAFVFGCQQQSSLKSALVEIDSLANKGDDKKALEMLEEIVPENIEDEEVLAYYWFLKLRTEIRLQKKIGNPDPIDISIRYYIKTKDNRKLARAYSYKAYVLDNLGRTSEALLCLKEAEKIIADRRDEALLANLVYSHLGRINHKSNENALSIYYSKKALKCAYIVGNDYYVAYSLMNIYIDYNDMGNTDSAQYYLAKYVPLVEKIPKNERSGFYANIGNAYIDTDMAKAEDYLNRSITIAQNVFAYRSLARIYYKRGDRGRAQEMWQKALQTDNLYLKAEVLQAMYDSQRDEGDYRTASETAMQIASLKDSIARQEKENDIRGLQEHFDQEQLRLIEHTRYTAIISSVIALLLLITALLVYLYMRNRKGRLQLQELRQSVEHYRNELKVLQKEGKTDSKQVEQLTQKIAELQAKQGALLQNGRERYEEIMAGGTTVRWDRNDFSDCIEYYRTLDASFVAHMEQGYRHLSAKYVFFALMEHIGRTDEDIQRVMAIGQGTIRSYRSRINSSKLEP